MVEAVVKNETGKALVAAVSELARVVDRLAAAAPRQGGGAWHFLGEGGPEFRSGGGGGGVGGAPGGVHPVRPIGGGGSGGAVSTLTINMPVGADREAIVRQLVEFEKRNGPGWRE